MNYTLEDFVGIVLHRTDLVLVAEMREKLEPYDITPEQNIIMLLLFGGNEGITQKEIAQRVNKDQANVARMLFHLEKKGFIQRITPEHDRRSFQIWLTKKGKALEENLEKISLQFNHQILKDITDKELTQFLNVLNRIRKNACE